MTRDEDAYALAIATRKHGAKLRRKSDKAMRVLNNYREYFKEIAPHLHRALNDYEDAQRELAELRHALRERT